MTQAEQFQQRAKESFLPPCCGTGCTVCVLDYPELFADQSGEQADDWQKDEAETLALLEAFERAAAEAHDEPK